LGKVDIISVQKDRLRWRKVCGGRIRLAVEVKVRNKRCTGLNKADKVDKMDGPTWVTELAYKADNYVRNTRK